MSLSFVFVGIYWNNHHHMMHAVHTVTGPILWANVHLLFWLTLVPFMTSWGRRELSVGDAGGGIRRGAVYGRPRLRELRRG